MRSSPWRRPTRRWQRWAAGFSVSGTDRLDGLDTALVTLQAPQGVSTRRALARLRALDSNGVYDFNHIHSESGVYSQSDVATRMPTRTAAPGDDGGAGVGVGLVDGGVGVHHPALAGARVETRAFAGVAIATPHGASVASLLVGRAVRTSLGVAIARH